MKSWIRIRTEVKSWIRIRIKLLRICHPAAYGTRQIPIQDTKKCTDTPEEDKSLGFKMVGSWQLEFHYLRDVGRAGEQPPRAPLVRQQPLETPRPSWPKHSVCTVKSKGLSGIHALGFKQCCGSVTFWYGSGSARIRTTDLRIRIMLFPSVAGKMPTKKNFFFPQFFAYYFLNVHLHQFP